MSYDLASIRAGLATALAPLIADGTLVQVSPYAKSNPSAPCAMVSVGASKFDEGVQTDLLTMTVAILVGEFSAEEAQMALDALLGRATNSVKALIEASALAAQYDLRVTEASGQRKYTLDTSSGQARPSLIGCEWTVEILT